MVQKLAAQGTKDSYSIEWDDGSDNDDVTKITVGGNSVGIQYIWFDYVKGQNTKEGSRLGACEPGFTQTFEINHLNNEQLESVEVYYMPNSTTIRGIQFKTTLRFFELIGYAGNCSKFSLSMEGKKIIGFYGSTGKGLDTLGAYFSWIVPTKSEAIGGKDSKEWDDGIDHEAVTKINVVHGRQGIQYIKFDYLKNGEHLEGSGHGDKGDIAIETFEINHVGNEYLVSVEGYCQSGIIQGLQFITNLKTSIWFGYDDSGEKFKIAVNGKKIIGFHGYAEKNLNSLGAYFTMSPFTKLNCSSDTSSGYLWDDGTYAGIRKVCATYDSTYLYGVTFYYDDGGKIKKSEHGLNTGSLKMEFEVDYPNEFITSVEGTYHYAGYVGYIESLIFKTSKGRTSPTFEKVTDTNPKFVLESKGCRIVGFHGYGPNNSNGLSSHVLGAYFCPLPTTSDEDKVEAEGGDGGISWDDGCFDGVRRIYIGLNQNAIAFIKFMYYKRTQKVFGDDHGSNAPPSGIEEFELDYPKEYVTSVEGSYDTESGAMTMLRFTTNTRTSPDFGVTATKNSSFILHKDDHKVVGFYGSSSSMLLYKIGVHLIPITQKSSPTC